MSLESLTSTSEKVWIEISRSALTHNVKRIRSILGPMVALLSVVKADAYGLGLENISKILWQAGANSFGVTDVKEGLLLRKILPEASILILGPSFSDNMEDILEYKLVPMISSLDLLRRLNEVAHSKQKKAQVHLMIDTGMGRIGLWYEKGDDFFKELLKLEAIEIQGVASHFASSDGQDLEFSKLQLQRFLEFLFKLKVMGFEIPIQHMANSAALMRLPESFFNMSRIGILMYGVYPSPWTPKDDFKAVFTWKTRVAFIKEIEEGRTVSYGSTFVAKNKTKIATLPVGYSHGYDRRLSNGGEVLIGGRRCPVVGRVTMDQIMVDLGLESSVKVDDEVVLIGSQGQERITLEEMAQKIDTVPYEIMCGLKVKKLYID